MKRNKLVKGLCLTILIAAVGGGSLAYAERGGNASKGGDAVTKEMKEGDQMPSNNQRQRMQLSVRREAARRLKTRYQEARTQQVQEHIKHSGHSEGGN